ncbi:MAG: rhodanese-like domain-containing protein, partial [Gammaproteobacteria bacterium]|nr:rhodanese-like domain-containing protein [Gammaproteobacteria bacterium]
PSNFKAQVDDALWLDSEAVQRGLEQREIVLIDARDEARFNGEHEPLDKVAGHIPGSINIPFEKNLDANGKFLTPEQLQANFSNTVVDFTKNKIVHSCGSGVTACHNILAMEIIGLSGSRLYPGSWSEWITDPTRPISTTKDA